MMTSRERMTAAWRCGEVDHTPLTFHFWPTPRHAQAVWGSERERLAFFRDHGWDTRTEVALPVTPSPEVSVEVAYEEHGTVLRQTWHTPAGTVEERLRVTEEWPGPRTAANPVGLGDDFRTPRYVEFPFKSATDLATLPYLFPRINPADDARLREQMAAARALTEEFAVPLTLYMSAGMDWLTWLFPPEEAVLRVMDDPACMQALLTEINAAYEARLQTALALGADGVIRRGWYESTDFWTPTLFAEMAAPALARQIAQVHKAGAAFLYLMDTGIMPLLPALAALPFDTLVGADPACSGQDMAAIRRALPGKAFWGGISGPLHLGMGTPADVERAVEDAFTACGGPGFILGLAVGIRHNWPWENLEALDRTWRRLR
jgi:hypothetical protein